MTEQSPAEAIFFKALEKVTPEERVAYIDAACGDDHKLRQRVERLLAAHPQVGDFLEPPAPPGVGTAEASNVPPRENWPAGLGQTETAPYESPVEDVGAVIAGKYKLLETLGQGGMGAVFMAQRTQPVKRLVALKLIKLGMDSKQVLARFGAERQALALMDHPNIAKDLDAGTTDSGRPFFVMELVKGVPITRFCDERQLSPRQRLELFIPVCQAIQHAHQKGIIHRDIKPSNVLVALYDDRSVPKVIDFGVAKATGQRLTDASLMTGFGGVVGTPEYMSPEQAQLNQLDIDTRSDVYALGVLLYELLTGTTPIDRKRLGQGALLEILRLVREEEPLRPSARLSTSEALASIAATRRTEPAKLARLMRGELDWIVMKCLEKDRSRRYETANGLAHDLEHYLADEPVEACPPSSTYRLRKLASKYKKALATAVTFAAVLLIGAVVSTWQAIRATNAEASALKETERAESNEIAAVVANEQTQDALTTSLFEQARAVRLSGLPGRRWRALELLKQAEQLRSRERLDSAKLVAGKDQSAVQHESLSRSQLRSEALAALLIDDAHVIRQWGGLAHSVSPDGTLAATFWADPKHRSGSLAIIDVKTGKEISKWKGHDPSRLLGVPMAIALGPHARRLAIVPYPMKRIEVWDLSSQKRLRQLAIAKQGSEAPPPETRSAKSGASKTPAVASSEWKAIVWLSPNGRYVCGVTNSPTGDRVVVWDLDGDAVGQPVGIVQGLPIAAFSPDNQLVAFVSRSKKVVLWNVATNRLDKEIELPLEPSGAVGFGPGGTLGIACAQSTEKRVSGSPGPQTLVIWDLAHHREMKRTGTIPGVPNSISFSPEGASVAISHGVAGNILVFNLADRKSAVPLNHGAMTRTLTWTDDGQHLLTGGLGSLKTWEFADESAASDLRLEVEQETSFGVPFALSPNGRFIAIQSRGMPNVELYDSMARKFVRRFPRDASDHKLPPHLWFSPDGKQLVVLTHQSVVIWDVDTATQRVRMDANRSQLQGFTSVGFRADGSVLVGGIANLMPAVFEAANGKEIWRGQGAGLAALVSLDGRFATIFASVLGRTQQSVSLVDLSTGKERSQLPGPPNGAVQTTLREFSPNGRWLLALHFGRSAATDHQEVTSSFGSAGPGYQGSGIAQQPWTADVLDVESGKRHMQIDGASNPIARVFSRDGRYLAVGMANGAIRFWDTQVREELFDWHPFGDHADESFLPQYLAFDADDANLVVPNPVSPAFRMLNLPRVNEQLGTAALNW